jgi:hypothetical protein
MAECVLALIGATPEGKKGLLGFQVGVRESGQSWRSSRVERTPWPTSSRRRAAGSATAVRAAATP